MIQSVYQLYKEVSQLYNQHINNNNSYVTM